MRLSGEYDIKELARTFQGNFSCESVVKDGKGNSLPEAQRHTRLELFFLGVEIYADRVDIYRTGSGDKILICSLPATKK